MRRYRIKKTYRTSGTFYNRYDRIVISGLILAGLLLFCLDGPAALSTNSAWAIANRFGSTDLALSSFLKTLDRKGQYSSILALDSIRHQTNTGWGGRDPERDFLPSRSLASAIGVPRDPVAGQLDVAAQADPAKPLQLEARITSGFGFRRLGGQYRHHDGLDVAMPYGTPIKAHEAGVVKYAGWIGGYGLTVVIDHGYGKETLYGHCSSILARPGDQVGSGVVIARVGNTGRSFGTHLHFEIRYGGVPVDPEHEYLTRLKPVS